MPSINVITVDSFYLFSSFIKIKISFLHLEKNLNSRCLECVKAYTLRISTNVQYSNLIFIKDINATEKCL